MCVIIPKQLTDYQKVILDKGAIIIMQIKEVAIVVQSRELVTEHIWSQVNIHSFGLPKIIRVYINLVPIVIYKRKRMKIELTNGGHPGPKGWMSIEGFVTWLDIS